MTYSPALLMLHAVKAQLEGSLNLLNIAHENLVAIHTTPAHVNTALMGARLALADVNKRIDQLTRIRDGAL